MTIKNKKSNIPTIMNKNNENKMILDTFYTNHPFVVAGKSDFEAITGLIEKYAHSSKYAEALMYSNSKEKVLLEVLDYMDNTIGCYVSDTIFFNRLDLKNDNKVTFQNLTHEYIHFLQDLAIRQLSPSIQNIWKKDYKNTVQDFYILMVMEADAYTKESLVLKENLTSNIMNKTFFTNLESLISKVNCEKDYHCYFKYLKMSMKAIFSHPDFLKIIKSALNSGTNSNGGIFPTYTFTFDTLSKIIDETIIENKKFEMLMKINHWSEEDARMKILASPYDYSKNDKNDWKNRLDNFCMMTSDKKRMKNLLNYLYNTKEL